MARDTSERGTTSNTTGSDCNITILTILKIFIVSSSIKNIKLYIILNHICDVARKPIDVDRRTILKTLGSSALVGVVAGSGAVTAELDPCDPDDTTNPDNPECEDYDGGDDGNGDDDGGDWDDCDEPDEPCDDDDGGEDGGGSGGGGSDAGGDWGSGCMSDCLQDGTEEWCEEWCSDQHIPE